MHLDKGSSYPHSAYHVAVIGAGMGGLLAARVLQLEGVTVTVFERDSAPTARLQGGTLDIHRESGQRALELAGLMNEFRAVARPEGQEITIRDKTGTVVHCHGGSRGAPTPTTDADTDDIGERPEVNRGQLRQLLLDSLAPDTIQWTAHVKTLEVLEDGTKVRVIFQDPSSSPTTLFDLAIGADGTWSHVRPLLTPTKPDYTGVTSIEISLHNIDADYPHLAKMVGAGMLSCLGDGKGLNMHRNSGATVCAYAMLHVPLTWAEESGVARMSPEDATAYLLEHHYADWDPRLKAFLDPACSPPCSPLPTRPFFQFKNYPSHSWETFTRVGGGGAAPITLVGDAAHVMVPFGGEGANLAMLDGAELAQTIVDSASDPDSLKRNIEAFEKKMMERAARAATTSLDNMFHFLHEDGDGAAKAANIVKEYALAEANGGVPTQ